MHTSDKCKKNRQRILKLNLPSFFSSIGNKIQSPASPKFYARALTSQTWVPLYSVKHCWNTGAAKRASPPPELLASFSDGALSPAARYWKVYEEEPIFGRRRPAQRRNHRNMLCRVCERCKWSVIRIYGVEKKKWRRESGANVCKKTASVGQKAPPSRHRLRNLKKRPASEPFVYSVCPSVRGTWLWERVCLAMSASRLAHITLLPSYTPYWPKRTRVTSPPVEKTKNSRRVVNAMRHVMMMTADTLTLAKEKHPHTHKRDCIEEK